MFIALLAVLIFAVLFWFKMPEGGATTQPGEASASRIIADEAAGKGGVGKPGSVVNTQLPRKRAAKSAKQAATVSAVSTNDAPSGTPDALVIASAPAKPVPTKPNPTKRPPGEIELVWVDPGAFLMGSPMHEVGRRDNEGLPTPVTITSGFWMGKYEITLDQFRRVIAVPDFRRKDWESWGGGPDRAVAEVSWYDATNFCFIVTERQRVAGTLPEGFVYRLPTEAEWEFACRAGSINRFGFGEDPAQLEDFAWYGDKIAKVPQPVGLKLPNAWGLYDMHGNAAEWCLDSLKLTIGDPLIDPVGIIHSDYHVKRGGAWDFGWEDCRSASRHTMLAIYKDTPQASIESGFRVVLARPIELVKP
jgi:formylglycine-generating enzyme required for sulfatase activity